jgi:hypothetical protein
MNGDALAFCTEVERAKRILLLAIESDPSIPELERQIAGRQINAAANGIVECKRAQQAVQLERMRRKAA